MRRGVIAIGTTGAPSDDPAQRAGEITVAVSASAATPSAVVSIRTQPSAAGEQHVPAGHRTQNVIGQAGGATVGHRQIGAQRETGRALAGHQRRQHVRASSTSVASALDATGPGTSAAAASSTIAHRSVTAAPAPPSSSATATRNRPSSARPA